MGFNAGKFEQRQYEHRTASVAVPELADDFPGGEEAVFQVRALSGPELSQMRNESARLKSAALMVEAIAKAQGVDQEGVAAVRASLGLDGSVPEESAQHRWAVHLGLVEPKLSYPLIVKLDTHFPALILRVARQVLELSGQGSEPGKREPSTGTPG